MAASARAVDPKLDPVCYPLLVLLRDADAIAMADLIGVLGIEKSTLTRRIDSAGRLGLVERIPDPYDARARLVALTPEGRRRLEEQRVETFRRWRDRLALWDPDDVRQLATLMHRLGDILD
ncbi:MarR family transcriptional regulator [Rhodococcus zopfii]|uniref:MarR family transcriptional regulator n=2 Tax=Rhodococcus zopfii TaxID=43772 RepID=A0ABU3WNS8_9NOCA|nr:MarR family transcriptional regulator [Rhodococcus zopfii]